MHIPNVYNFCVYLHQYLIYICIYIYTCLSGFEVSGIVKDGFRNDSGHSEGEYA